MGKAEWDFAEPNTPPPRNGPAQCRLIEPPLVLEVTLRGTDQQTKIMVAELSDGTYVRASRMSEGLLFYLAFAALQHLGSAGVVLVEEPENGLHPSRIAEVMRVLRDLSEHRRVLIATHSAPVVNALKGDEVTVVTRPSVAAGTRLTLLRDTPSFEKRSGVFALGELWLGYADGELSSTALANWT